MVYILGLSYHDGGGPTCENNVKTCMILIHRYFIEHAIQNRAVYVQDSSCLFVWYALGFCSVIGGNKHDFCEIWKLAVCKGENP